MSLSEAERKLAEARQRVADLVVMGLRPGQSVENLQLLAQLERSARAEVKLRRKALAYQQEQQIGGTGPAAKPTELIPTLRPTKTAVDKLKIVARWIALGPAAALAALITPALVKYVNRLTLYVGGFDPDTLLGRAYIEAIAGLAAGAAFVYVGTRVAPDHRRNVAITLAAIGLFVTGASVLGDLVTAHYWLALQGACAAVGGCALAYSIVKGEIKLEPAIVPSASPMVAATGSQPDQRQPLAGAQPSLAETLEQTARSRPAMTAAKAIKLAGGWAAAIAILMGVSYCSEAPKYRFERIAKSEAAAVPGARQLNAIRVADIASPVSWFWPPATILNFAVPDPLMDSRFYQFSAQYEEADTAVFLLDVDCKDRKAEWYDLDEPDTAFPARNLWGEPVVAPNGKTYRRSKAQMAMPADWLHAFCDTDWTVERKAAGAAMFKTAPK